jgi:hypothetical protein
LLCPICLDRKKEDNTLGIVPVCRRLTEEEAINFRFPPRPEIVRKSKSVEPHITPDFRSELGRNIGDCMEDKISQSLQSQK